MLMGAIELFFFEHGRPGGSLQIRHAIDGVPNHASFSQLPRLPWPTTDPPPRAHRPTRWSAAAMTASSANQIIRPSEDRDVPAIAAIYQHHVLFGTASFETEPPSI